MAGQTSSPADDAADVAARLEHIHTLTEQLVRTQAGSTDADSEAACVSAGAIVAFAVGVILLALLLAGKRS